ncbi:hypothetical protein EYF80_049864 [Liparis tanakae]|uniref:Uncharacterized protein n=1 Tax=Liparis tanakae TaxID=230148 RepID=A0A4Z2FFH1_9TELE|nr:hypothetical protein EYF80_049864 [Liparis tanakae]
MDKRQSTDTDCESRLAVQTPGASACCDTQATFTLTDGTGTARTLQTGSVRPVPVPEVSSLPGT